MSAKRTAVSSPRRKADRAPSRGQANLAALRRVSDATIARTSPPELADLPEDFWAAAVPVTPVDKTPISLRVDADVLAWFRALGPRYQTRMNAVLRSYMEHAERAAPRQHRPKQRASSSRKASG